MLKMLDLFSGIGGFSLAASWTGEIETVAFVEIDKFCQKVLKKHWPDVPIIPDIREVTSERIREIIADTKSKQTHTTKSEGFHTEFGGKDRKITGNSKSKRHTENGEIRQESESHTIGIDKANEQPIIHLLTGGFPCQPFSCAGKRKGKTDDRHLWPEMLRVIKLFRPAWVVGENVAGILSMAQPDGNAGVGCEAYPDAEEYESGEANGILWGIINDLEDLNYKVQPFIIPACAVGAPHRRDRVWILANSKSTKQEWNWYTRTGRNGPANSDSHASNTTDTGFEGLRQGRENPIPQFTDNASHAYRFNGNNAGHGTGEISQQQETEICGCTITDTRYEGLQGGEQQGTCGERQGSHGSTAECNNAWNEHWYEVALRTCVRRVDDGLPRGVDRTNRLKALGNSIVPHIAYHILQGIVEIEKEINNGTMDG